MKTLISIDPGLSTGIIVGTYSDTEPFRVTHAFQIEGGVEGFIKQVSISYTWLGGDTLLFVYLPGVEEPIQVGEGVTVLVEKFTARGAAAGPFALKTDALEPLRIEGAILALGIDPTWVSPPQQYFMGGESKTEKLKNRNAWFKEHAELGYYLTGKSVGQKDADDARSALAHCISWLRREKHLPTLELFRKEDK